MDFLKKMFGIEPAGLTCSQTYQVKTCVGGNCFLKGDLVYKYYDRVTDQFCKESRYECACSFDNF